MLSTQRIREVAEAYIDCQSRGDLSALIDLCVEDVRYSGILVKKITGEASGTIRGKDAVRSLIKELGNQMGRVAPAVRALGVGIDSAVISVTMFGSIPMFAVLVMDDSAKITEIRMHQEMP